MCIRDRVQVGAKFGVGAVIHVVAAPDVSQDGRAALVAQLGQGVADLGQPPVVVGVSDDAVRLAACLLYTSDAADERSSVDLGGRRIIKKKTKKSRKKKTSQIKKNIKNVRARPKK